ncbi:MAG: hypothetical protein ACI9IP_000248 [Arcticibacterium sp.]|jgi:hypothetical protein
MKRRDLLKNLALGSGALLTLPSWTKAWNASSWQTEDVFSLAQSATLSSIAGTFIPEGKSEPGAMGVGVDKYLERLIADCYDAEQQAKIEKGLELLTETSKNTYNMGFSECTQDQRESLLLGFSAPSTSEKEWFYNTLRGETIRGYTTSEYVMVNHYDYVMAPGYYHGCVDVVES